METLCIRREFHRGGMRLQIALLFPSLTKEQEKALLEQILKQMNQDQPPERRPKSGKGKVTSDWALQIGPYNKAYSLIVKSDNIQDYQLSRELSTNLKNSTRQGTEFYDTKRSKE
jgi:hypothetical protein